MKGYDGGTMGYSYMRVGQGLGKMHNVCRCQSIDGVAIVMLTNPNIDSIVPATDRTR
jgi:hypothetical protein